MQRDEIRSDVSTMIADSATFTVDKLVDYIMAEWEDAALEGFKQGYEEGLSVGQSEVNERSFQEGYNAGHNTFIEQIVHTLDFRGQEAMIEHIERAIGFEVRMGNAC